MPLCPEKNTATEIIVIYAIGLEKPKSSWARKKADMGHLVAAAKRPIAQRPELRAGLKPISGAKKAPKAPPEKSKGLISPPLKEKAAIRPVRMSLIKKASGGI